MTRTTEKGGAPSQPETPRHLAGIRFGKRNGYACQSCDAKLVAIDSLPRLTSPFAISCYVCKSGTMYSEFYPDWIQLDGRLGWLPTTHYWHGESKDQPGVYAHLRCYLTGQISRPWLDRKRN